MELRNFKFVATNSQGKTIKGKIETGSRIVCVKYLKSKNYEIVKITEYWNVFTKLNNISFGSSLKTKHLVFFLKQFGSLLKAGVGLLPALEILSLQQENRQHRKLYFELYQQVYNGITFSKALSKRPKEFPKLMVQMIEVGELTGTLPQTVLNMANHFETQMKLTSQIKGAIRMPLVYLLAAILISIGMLLFVFPNITGLFASFGDAKIPGITQFFLDVGDFMANYALIIFGTLFLLITVIGFLNKYVPSLHYAFTVMILKFPIFGLLVQMNNQILIANTLSQMMGNGINSMKALETVKSAIKNVVYKKLMTQTLTYIEDGKPFSRSFLESPYIDHIMSKMISTGERTGDIPKLLDNLAVYYNGITEIKVEQLKNSLQPILLLIVYGIVGVLILALMLPMLSLGTQI